MSNNDNQKMPDPTNGSGTSDWLSLKEAANVASKCTQTIRRAVNRDDIESRRRGSGKNAPIEVSKASLEVWLGAKIDTKTTDPSDHVDSGDDAPGTDAATTNSSNRADSDDETPAKKARKVNRTKKQRSHKPMPREARLMRRWKNSMRKATPTQMISMIAWLSARIKTSEKGRTGKSKARPKQKDLKAARCRKERPSRRHRHEEPEKS